MTVYFFECHSVAIITTWENPPVVPCIGDGVRLEIDSENQIIQRIYQVTGRTILKDSVHIFCKFADSETIIPKNEQRTN